MHVSLTWSDLSTPAFKTVVATTLDMSETKSIGISYLIFIYA